MKRRMIALSLLVVLVAPLMLLLQANLVLPNTEAQITKPSIPEFTLKYVDNSYYVPPTYGIDQYTGQTIVKQEGYLVDNRTLQFTIKNQPFTSYNDSNGNHIALYYNFRYKGTCGNDWSYYPDTSRTYGYYTGEFPDTSASNSDFTVIMINLRALTIPTGVKVEFQVQAIMGYIDIESTGMMAGGFCGFAGERSDWSNTQTITIDANGSTSTPNTSPPQNSTSTPEPQEQEQPQSEPFLTALVAVVSVVSIVLVGIGLLVYFKKRNHKGE